MHTDKKNQHYIPKFYLRNFSFEKNEKQIGIYNINNKYYFQTAKLKTQGSKNFFYGTDGVIEDKLAFIEGDLATCIKNLISSRQLPKKKSKTHIDLLTFVGLTHLRNPVAIENIKNMAKNFNTQIQSMGLKVDSNALMPEISHDEAIKLALSNVPRMIENAIDLEYKFLINDTFKPFIGSDFPVIKYNSFLENKKWEYGRTGYSSKGLQIIIPLNYELSIIFYDSAIYKVGSKKNNYLKLNDEADIKQLNILQFINCHNTIFFNELASETYIKKLHLESSKWKRANQTESSLHHMIKTDDKKSLIVPNSKKQKNLIISGTTECEINLNITGIKIHSRGKKSKLSTNMAQIRSSSIKRKKNYR